MKRLLGALICLFLLFTTAPACADREPPIPPTMDLSAVRYILCKTADGQYYTGSGFLIGDKILATAFHVAEGNWAKMPAAPPTCYDTKTETKIVAYKLDIKHDFALMTGPGLPTDIPYFTYDCTRPIAGHEYVAMGITDYGQKHPILRTNTLLATSKITNGLDPRDWVEGIPSPGMRHYERPDAPGMSGGPVVNLSTGNVVAATSAGDSKTVQDYDLADTILCQR